MPFVLEGMPNSFLFITVSALMENCEFLDIAKILSPPIQLDKYRGKIIHCFVLSIFQN